jgi:hypothetical protein
VLCIDHFFCLSVGAALHEATLFPVGPVYFLTVS